MSYFTHTSVRSPHGSYLKASTQLTLARNLSPSNNTKKTKTNRLFPFKKQNPTYIVTHPTKKHSSSCFQTLFCWVCIFFHFFTSWVSRTSESHVFNAAWKSPELRELRKYRGGGGLPTKWPIFNKDFKKKHVIFREKKNGKKTVTSSCEDFWGDRSPQSRKRRRYMVQLLCESACNLPSLKLTNCTWQWMLGRRLFPFGARPIFRG